MRKYRVVFDGIIYTAQSVDNPYMVATGDSYDTAVNGLIEVIELMTPEGLVKQKVFKILEAHNIWHEAQAASRAAKGEVINGSYYMPSSSHYGVNGIEDIAVHIGPFYIGVETKTKRGVQSAGQVRRQQVLYYSGAIYILFRPDDESEDLLNRVITTLLNHKVELQSVL